MAEDKTYRVIGMGGNGSHTIAGEYLFGIQAEVLRLRLRAQARFSEVVIEPETALDRSAPEND